jgi:acyl dehydratase
VAVVVVVIVVVSIFTRNAYPAARCRSLPPPARSVAGGATLGRTNAGKPTDQNSLALPGDARKISPGSRRSTSWSGREPARKADRQEQAVKEAYLEDLAPGQVFTSDSRAVVDAASIKRFSGEFDRQPFHLDEAAAQTTFFGEMVASGWHTTAMTMQLIVDALPLSHGIIGSGVDELRWPRPVRPGDTLHLHCEILAVTPSKLHPSRGIVRVRMTTLNQKDQPVQTMVANLLAFRRPEPDA